VAIAIRNWVLGLNNGSSPTVTADTASGTGSTPQAGDLAVVVYGNNYYAFTDMGTPSGGPTWTAITNGSADAGNLLAHIRSYTGTVASSANFSVSATETGSADEEKYMLILVLSGADTSTPIDGGSNGAVGSFGSSTDVQVVSAVTPTGTDAWLLSLVSSGGGSAAATYTHPSGMTELTEIHQGGLSGTVSYQQLAASGSTGTRTHTADGGTAVPWAGLNIAIKTASAGVTKAPPPQRLHRIRPLLVR
jgi:hypothetical protein